MEEEFSKAQELEEKVKSMQKQHAKEVLKLQQEISLYRKGQSS